MSMEHKAFHFDWASFENELLPKLRECIEKQETLEIVNFISENEGNISDPYEGEKIERDIIETLDELSVQEILDYSLTKYYSVKSDFGLGSSWTELNLSEQVSKGLLGTAIKGFDPGFMGSYFQNESMLNKSLSILANEKSSFVKIFISELKNCKKGLYVTF